ncbi:MAG: F0F1 ATP synthase subunit delta [Gammaproteobacteria bacterium]|nr:F0F1 ATP synthase subunit delta [Gammaproteobacteria bacterium]
MMNSDQLTTIARPYATAVFAEAVATQTLPAWRVMLFAASFLTEDAAVQALLMQPNLSAEKLAQFYCDVLAEILNPEQKNFIRLLAENHRINALPEIAKLFHQKEEEFNQTLTVRVQSAIPLTEAWCAELIAKLTTRLKRRIELVQEIDESVVAGAIVTAGDRVMDGSVRGKLARLKETVTGIF